jgi:hypothetical protein
MRIYHNVKSNLFIYHMTVYQGVPFRIFYFVFVTGICKRLSMSDRDEITTSSAADRSQTYLQHLGRITELLRSTNKFKF